MGVDGVEIGGVGELYLVVWVSFVFFFSEWDIVVLGKFFGGGILLIFLFFIIII